MSFFGLHQYGNAVPYLQKASNADPANLEILGVLAKPYLWSKNYQCALAEFKLILNVNPDAVQAHMMLAEALDAMNRKGDAINELENAEHSSPDEPTLHFELGYLYYTQHNYEKAAPEFELEIKNNPKYALAYTYLGDIALRNNDGAVAASYLSKAISLQDDLRLAYFDLGCVYADQKRNQEALAAFLRAERLDPSEPDAHYRLARVYLVLDEKQKANEEFAKTKALHAKAEESLIQKVSGTGEATSKKPK
jgi:tetratricopeptide (TPR) repeat protein